MVFIIVFLLLTAGSAFAGPAPQRIVSLSPAMTSELYDLGVEGRIVGVTRFCKNPGKSKEIVGTLTDISLEKITALKPDLVIAGKDANRKRDIEKLKSMGFRVEIFEGCENFDCMCREFIRLGGLVGKAREASGIVDSCRNEVIRIKAQAGNRGCTVLWQVGVNPLIVAGGATFANEYISLSGCKNVFGDIRSKYPRVNMEEALLRNAEIIIMITGMGMDTSSWKSKKGIRAVQTGRIYAVSADKVCQATPVKFVDGLKMVSAILSGGTE